MTFRARRIGVLLAAGAVSLWSAESIDWDEYLSRQKRQIFDLQEQSNLLESTLLKRSWVNPLTLSYSVNTSESFGKETTTRSYSVSIDQPIFKSGGIYYAVKYAQAQEGANSLQIRRQRRGMIVQTLTTLFSLRKNRLQQRQARLRLRNDAIDIRRKQEQYDAGVIDSSFLNQAILQRNRDQTTLLGLQLAEKSLRSQFAQLSDKDPDRLTPPKLRLIDAETYRRNHLELQEKRLRVIQSDYNAKMTRSKYLPTLSLNANITHTDSDAAYPIDPHTYRYGFRLSMPLNINAPVDMEASRVRYLRQSVELEDDRKRVESDYRLILDNIKILEKKIALARSDARLYASLLKSTKEQAQAGQKTSADVETMRNAKAISELDERIYAIDRQIELLKLYAASHP